MVDEKASQMRELYDSSFREIKEGQIVNGKIVAVNQNEALIDIGYKSEGVIPVAQFSKDELAVGRDIDVYIESIEDDAGTIILSSEKAQ